MAGQSHCIDLAAALIIYLWKFPVQSGAVRMEHGNRIPVGSGGRTRVSRTVWEAITIYCKQKVGDGSGHWPC